MKSQCIIHPDLGATECPWWFEPSLSYRRCWWIHCMDPRPAVLVQMRTYIPERMQQHLSQSIPSCSRNRHKTRSSHCSFGFANWEWIETQDRYLNIPPSHSDSWQECRRVADEIGYLLRVIPSARVRTSSVSAQTLAYIAIIQSGGDRHNNRDTHFLHRVQSLVHQQRKCHNSKQTDPSREPFQLHSALDDRRELWRLEK